MTPKHRFILIKWRLQNCLRKSSPKSWLSPMKEPKEGKLGRRIVGIAFDYVHDRQFSSTESSRVAGDNDMQIVTVGGFVVARCDR